MSQSPSYWRDGACASPESPEEGDFSPQQLYHNLKSLEEHETCEDQKDPIVNIIPDNFGCLLNSQICAPLATNDLGKLCAGVLPEEQLLKKSHWREPWCFSTSPIKKNLIDKEKNGADRRVSIGLAFISSVSPEFIEVRTLDGRFITLVSTQTQTDWEWVEQSLSFSCQVQKEIEALLLLQAEVASTDTDSSEESEDEKMLKKEYDTPCVGPPRLIAFKPEPKQTPHDGKVPEVESKQDVHFAMCDYCQQLCQPFIHSELLGNETDFERLFCCEQAKKIRALILEEKEKLAQKESHRKIDVNPHAPVMSEKERKAAKEQARKRLRHLQLQRKIKNDNLKKELSLRNKTSVSPSTEIDIKIITGLSALLKPTAGEPKEVIKKFYKSGQCFLTLCPDGTGNVFYPSGKAAIIISSAEAADFTYIILEDKDVAPSIKGIFTNKGHSTCYHPNGMIWLNLTPVGGLCLNETGAKRRRWNWLYFDPHIRTLPFKPLTFALGPHISVRIHSQECMYITFAHRQNSVRFSVGSKLKNTRKVKMQTLDQPGTSSEMDSTTNPGLANKNRVVTRVTVGTQTNWRNEGEHSQDYEYPNQETSKAPHKNLGLTSGQKSGLRQGKYPQDGLQRRTTMKSVPKNMKSELEISPDNEVLDSLSKETPQTPTACQGETEESLTNLDKAWKLSKILLKGATVITEETMTDTHPAMQKDQRLKGLEFDRSSNHQTPKAGLKQQASATLHNQLSDDTEDVSLLDLEIMDSENTFSFKGHAGQKSMMPLVKHYKNGQTFSMILPDGTGHVCYPSGRLAILVSAAQSADWSCAVVLEDSQQPHIQAVFTTRGQGTCYHNNGCIWVNVTPWGGTYCSDTGDLKKHWRWLDNQHHDHVPPWQPLCLTLSPHLSIRIQSQEHICIAFTSGKYSVRLNVGAKLKLNQGKGLTLPGPDMLQSYLQQKSAEINVLLQNIQSLITYQKTVSAQKVKPQQSLISQIERRRLPMKQQQSAKKTP
ncbi:uncharacterized protein LOC123973257 isoform X3 [Micropterus dolomieu]|uniref:uncharacterized protein LOC123973257 isoform X3 n=1 Tax=Micropterus dolomieu TaxID=147949 RepID=UPI001E8DB62A|nr:uncharacterized protein LOC123973257 isoform X3 [Micropterus dolomieu]